MRLIDADLLTQKVKGWLNTDSNSDSIMIDANESVACVLREIEEQPTAYDVDKVVEQLNELKEYDVCANISCETCSYTGRCWEGERGQKVAIDRAVEIAKGGGIEW